MNEDDLSRIIIELAIMVHMNFNVELMKQGIKRVIIGIIE